ncbi:MAG TPA: alpha/beta hydrolase [Fimbriimonadaceae bacterium]|nr:alpha/beta hydrolase [Fimbriimonadaceae bacterium]
MIWLFAGIGLYLLALFGIALFSLHPIRTPHFISPGLLGTPQEEIEIVSTKGVNLKCWWVDAGPRSNATAILCHGYVMNRSELTPVAHWLWQRGISSLLVEFRAHGKSGGGVTTIGVREADDVVAAVAEARRRRPGTRTLLIGSSMGSAACAFAAGQGVDADAIVLDSCYSRLIRASFGWWRFLGNRAVSIVLGPSVFFAGPLAGINPFKVDVAKALESTTCPVLILHGRCDDLAEPCEAERNLAALGGRGEIVWFEGCGHSEFRWQQPELYYRELEAFLRRTGFLD